MNPSLKQKDNCSILPDHADMARPLPDAPASFFFRELSKHNTVGKLGREGKTGTVREPSAPRLSAPPS